MRTHRGLPDSGSCVGGIVGCWSICYACLQNDDPGKVVMARLLHLDNSVIVVNLGGVIIGLIFTCSIRDSS